MYRLVVTETIEKNKYAVTVSKNYHDQLHASISENLKHFKKWFIITEEDDHETIKIINHFKEKDSNNVLELVLFPLQAGVEAVKKFYNFDEEDLEIGRQCSGLGVRDDPTFEKGLSMRYVQKYILAKYTFNPTDVIVYMDSDIILPEDFSEIIDSTDIEEEYIYGAQRLTYLFLDDALSDAEPFSAGRKFDIGIGYLQVCSYHHLFQRKEFPPVFFKRSLNCGWTDWEFKVAFMKKIDLKFRVKHLGLDYINWDATDLEKTFFVEELSLKQKNHITEEFQGLVRTTKRKRRRKEQEGMSDCKYPDFIIAGFQKCGTTALRFRLGQHPKITMPDSTGKRFPSEFAYFAEEYGRGQQWYKSHFLKDENLWGEKSPSYTTFRSKAPAKRISEQIPECKIIMSMRDPVEREISAYLHYLSEGWIDKNIPMEQVFASNEFYINYNNRLKPYYEFLCKDQILLLVFEEMIKYTEQEMQKICWFLGVEKYDFAMNWIHIRDETGKHVNHNALDEEWMRAPSKGDYKKWMDFKKKRDDLISEESRQILIDKYEKPVLWIEKLFGRKMYLWKNFN